MNYKIKIDRVALKFINKQDHEQRRSILSAISKLPHAGDIKRLESDGELYRLRVGSYRIIYSVNHGELVVHVIGADNRGDVYKRY